MTDAVIKSLPETKILKKEKPESDWRRKKSAIAIGAHAVTALCFLASYEYSGDVLLGPKLAIERLEDHKAPEVPPDRIAKIVTSLKTDKSADINKAYDKAYSEIDRQRGDLEIFRELEVKAKESGLSLGNYPRVLDQLHNSHTASALLEAMNAYTKDYGLKVSIAKGQGIKDIFIDLDTISNAQLDSPEGVRVLKDEFLAMAGALSPVPTEVVKYSGAKEVKIVKDLRHGEYSGEAGVQNGIIYIATGEEGVTITHEIGHFIDHKINGTRGMYVDPGYQKLNRKKFKYGEPSTIRPGDVAKSYGDTNPAEDKATIYENLLCELPWYIFEESRPVKAKAIYLLAELDAKVPGMANYLNSITPRQ